MAFLFNKIKAPKWIAPISDLDKIDNDTAYFYFEQAEKRLNHLLEISDRTTNRAISILTGLTPLQGFLLSVLFRFYFQNNADEISLELLALTWFSSIVCIVSILFSSFVAFPRRMHQMGREPKYIFTKEIIDDTYYKGKLQYKNLLVAEIEDLQQRISFMQKQNNNRVLFTKISFLIFTFYTFISILILVYLV